MKDTEDKKEKNSKKEKKVPKKETKKDLLESIRKHKQDIQKIRFKLSGELQQKGGERRKLRKAIAQASTKLTALAKEKAKNSDSPAE